MAETKNSSNIAELQAMIAALNDQNAALKAQAAKRNTLTLKVGEKLGVCVCGLGRFPTSLYVEQWERFFEGCTGGLADKMRDFIVAHPELKRKS